jgi:hypothetical protein
MSLTEKLTFNQNRTLQWLNNLLQKCNSPKEAKRKALSRQNNHKNKKISGKKKKEKKSRKKNAQQSKETSNASIRSKSKKKIQSEAKAVLIQGTFPYMKISKPRQR